MIDDNTKVMAIVGVLIALTILFNMMALKISVVDSSGLEDITFQVNITESGNITANNVYVSENLQVNGCIKYDCATSCVTLGVCI